MLQQPPSLTHTHMLVVRVVFSSPSQSSPSEFYDLVGTLNRISQQLDSFPEMAASDLKSELLLRIIREVCLERAE